MSKIIASMATYPKRGDTLENVIDSLVEQVDIFYIYLNEYKKIPPFIKQHQKVVPILGDDSYGDISASGKMIFLDYENTSDDIVFVVDDDFIYPQDYVETLLENLAKFDNHAACTIHGSVIPDFATWYYDRTVLYDINQNVNELKVVNLLGSGTTAFMLGNLKATMQDFIGQTAVDLTLSLFLLQHNIPIVVIPRHTGWIKHLEYVGLFERFKQEKFTVHTELLQTNPYWKLKYLKSVWRSLYEKEYSSQYKSIFLWAIDKEIELDFIATVDTKNTPKSFMPTLRTLQRFNEYQI